MKETFYITNNNLAILNFTKKYCKTVEDLVSSEGYVELLRKWYGYCQKTNAELANWLWESSKGEPIETILYMSRALMIFGEEEIGHPAMENVPMLLNLIESIYEYWRSIQRYSVLYTRNEEGLQLTNFLEANDEFDRLCLNFYRTCQEKVQGHKNNVYRQLQAGTNGSVLLQDYDWDCPKGYEKLLGIPFVSTLMLRTPLIIHPATNKREGAFEEVSTNPLQHLVKEGEEWMCLPCKVGELLIFVYFHRDFMPGAMAMPNLFELAAKEDCTKVRPDGIMIFGNKDGKDETVFYHDQPNGIWVGNVSYAQRIEYFGYLKKMALTLHNLRMIEKGYLPIHGAMVAAHLKDGRCKNIMFMGDSGAGKSETIEAFTKLAHEQLDHMEVIFDDMGSIHLDNGQVYAQGTEVGAFVRLDDLDKGSAYRDLDRSIFFNPESANSRVVLPASPYKVVVANHKVDIFMYANNYEDKRGLEVMTDMEKAKEIFISGKRMALGTTQEKGLSSTFFANPFGPMQKQAECLPIIDTLFAALAKQATIGQIYTCLGLPDKGQGGIEEAAQALLDLVR